MPELTMVEAIRDAISSAMEIDERVMVMGEDVGRMGGVFRATEGLQERFGVDRVVDMPIAEGVIAGSAVGLAVSGMRPIAEIQFFGFAQQAFHQIAGQISRYRARSRGRFPMPIVLRAAFGGGVRTPELHADSLEAHYVNCPGLKIAVPGTAADARGLLATAIRDDDPVLFLEPLRGYRGIKDEVPDDHLVPFGKARLAREGDDVTIIAWSAAVHLALKAADIAQSQGVSCSVVDLRTLVPLDVETIARAVAHTSRAVVIQEAPLTGGFAAEVIATIQEEIFFSLDAPIARVAAWDVPFPLAGAEPHYLPDVDRVVAAVLKTAAV